MLINCWMGEEREVKERCYCERKVKILLIDARCFFPTSHTTHNTHTHNTHTVAIVSSDLPRPVVSGRNQNPSPLCILRYVHLRSCVPSYKSRTPLKGHSWIKKHLLTNFAWVHFGGQQSNSSPNSQLTHTHMCTHTHTTHTHMRAHTHTHTHTHTHRPLVQRASSEMPGLMQSLWLTKRSCRTYFTPMYSISDNISRSELVCVS